MASPTDDAPNNLFTIAGVQLAFDLSLIDNTDLAGPLTEQIKNHGGRVVDKKDEVSWRFMLYQDGASDVAVLAALSQSTQYICLKWEWVLECLDQKRFVGPMDQDYGGFRFSIQPPHPVPIPQSYTSPYHTYVPIDPSPSVPRLDSPTLPGSPHSDVASTAVDAQSPRTTPRQASAEISAAKPKPLKRGRSVASSSKSEGNPIKRIKSQSQAEDKAAQSVSATKRQNFVTDTEWVPVAMKEPTPPEGVPDQWFGWMFSDADKKYLARYVEYFCNRERDPDFDAMFRDMAKKAHHHKASVWSGQYEKLKWDLVDKLPCLKRLYYTSSDEDTTKAKRPHRTIAVKQDTAASKIPEDERKELVKFMAKNWGSELSQEDLIKQFVGQHRSSSTYRVWSQLVKENQHSFDRAIAKRRATVHNPPKIYT